MITMFPKVGRTTILWKRFLKMKKILFTGGGTGGHVTLNLSLIPLFLRNEWQVVYIGSETGIEKELVAKISGVKYYAVKTGKLRRYFSWQNIKDMFKIPLGILQSFFIIRREKPDIIFSKGGFVSFPVVVGGFLNHRKIFMHESDLTPGLANKMSLPFVSRFFTTFKDTADYVKDKNKIFYVGPILSDRLKNGDATKGRELCRFTDDKPVVMFVGGSLGAQSLNKAVEKNLPALQKKFNIVHICGKGQHTDTKRPGYAQFEFVDREFKDLLAMTDIVVSRSGSNAIFEFWSLRKPMLLVPLPTTASRGEQLSNAENFRKRGFAEVIRDADLENSSVFLEMINKIADKKNFYSENMLKSDLKSTTNNELYQDIVNE